MVITTVQHIGKIDVVPQYTGGTLSVSVAVRTDTSFVDESGAMIGQGPYQRFGFDLNSTQVEGVRDFLISLGISL